MEVLWAGPPEEATEYANAGMHDFSDEELVREYEETMQEVAEKPTLFWLQRARVLQGVIGLRGLWGKVA
mgnify:FL=1